MSATLLEQLVSALADGRLRVVDLTQPLGPDTPVIGLTGISDTSRLTRLRELDSVAFRRFAADYVDEQGQLRLAPRQRTEPSCATAPRQTGQRSAAITRGSAGGRATLGS